MTQHGFGNGFWGASIVNPRAVLGHVGSIPLHSESIAEPYIFTQLLGSVRGTRIGERRLGQDDDVSLNRLLNVRVNVLLSRGATIIPPVLKDAPFLWSIMPLLGIWPERFGGYSGDAIKARFPVPPDDWTEAETGNLSAAAASPSREELQDVALIDSLYVTSVARLPVKMAWMTPKDVYAALHKILCDKHQIGIRQGYTGPGVGDPFYCSGASQEGLFRFTQWPSATEYFGLKLDEAWEGQRLAAYNAKVFSDVLRTYPFPGPIPLAPGFWYHGNRQALADLVNSGLIFDATLARFFITLLTLTSYEAVAARIISWAKKAAKKDTKWAIIRIAATVALGAIFSAALAPAIAAILPVGIPVSGATAASAITAVARDQFNEMELEKLSKDLEDAAKIFAVNDPIFAEEVRIANMTLEWFAGEFETSADALSQMGEQAQDPPPTPDEFGVNMEYPEDSPLEKALLGVGAGAGVAGLLWFLLR